MSDEHLQPELDLELSQAIQELKTKREPWYLDRWLIATFAALGGAAFMYVARQPEIDHFKNAAPLRSPMAKGLASIDKQAPPRTNAVPPQDVPENVSKPLPNQTGSATAKTPGSEKPATDAQAEKDTPQAKDKGADKPSAKPVGLSGAMAEPPMNPLGGGTFDISREGGLPAPGAPGTLPAVSPDPLPGLTVSGSGGDGAGAVLSAIAKKLGGGLRKYTEYTGRDKAATGYVVWVPEKNGRTFLDKLKSARGIDISDEQEGSSESRNRIMTEGLRSALAKLTKQRADLLIKYYEDAPAVKEVDNQIAEVNKSMASLRAPGAGYAVAKIETG